MNLQKITDYQIKTSRSGDPVPVMNQIHLHSIYDPKKEASGLIQNNKELFQEHSKVLVLGLGFAYHIQEAIKQLKTLHKKFQIKVIEPNLKLYTDSKHYNPIDSEFVSIYSSDDIIKLYSNIELVDFLSDRPGVLAHPASFNINEKFFRSFLTYKANQNLEAINTNIINPELREFTTSLNPQTSLDQNIKNYLGDKNQITHELDHLIMAYRDITIS